MASSIGLIETAVREAGAAGMRVAGSAQVGEARAELVKLETKWTVKSRGLPGE